MNIAFFLSCSSSLSFPSCSSYPTTLGRCRRSLSVSVCMSVGLCVCLKPTRSTRRSSLLAGWLPFLVRVLCGIYYTANFPDVVSVRFSSFFLLFFFSRHLWLRLRLRFSSRSVFFFFFLFVDCLLALPVCWSVVVCLSVQREKKRGRKRRLCTSPSSCIWHQYWRPEKDSPLSIIESTTKNIPLSHQFSS